MPPDPLDATGTPQNAPEPEPADRLGGRVGGDPPGFASVVGYWLRTTLAAVVIFAVVRTSIIEAFKIPTSSMENTLLVGDFLLVNKAVYGAEVPGTQFRLPALAEPRRGDVIVFRPPHEPDRNYVKRVVGVPDDTLEMRDKVLIVNGRPVVEPYARYVDRAADAVHPAMEWQASHLLANPSRRYRPTRDNWGPIVIPPARYFVLGDNRDNSEDSRYWGFVDRDRIRGRPWVVYYSFERSPEGGEGGHGGIRWSRIGARIH